MALDSTQTLGLSPTVARSAFTDAMSALASGVVMVTTRVDDRPWGTTVSAFTSISAEPPTILVSLRSDAATAQAIDESGRFGVSILGRHHGAVARHGSKRGASKFLERFAAPARHGLTPSVAGALAHLDCELTEQLQVADHTIFVGRVRDVRIVAGGEPLVYFRRAYRRLARRTNPFHTRRTTCPSS